MKTLAKLNAKQLFSPRVNHKHDLNKKCTILYLMRCTLNLNLKRKIRIILLITLSHFLLFYSVPKQLPIDSHTWYRLVCCQVLYTEENWICKSKQYKT